MFQRGDGRGADAEFPETERHEALRGARVGSQFAAHPGFDTRPVRGVEHHADAVSAAAPQAVYRSVSACPSVQIAPPTSPARSRSPQMGERGESESTKAAYSSLLMRIVLISCAQYDRTRENYALCKKQRGRRFRRAFVRQLTERIGADALRFFRLI